MTVFYVHRGNPFYLKYSLAQSGERFPDARLVLLGDASNRPLAVLAEHHFLADYLNGAEDFESRYIHMSPNSRAFELFCFQRWFVIAEFVMRHRVTGPVLYLDSDVLVYEDVFLEMADRGVSLATTRVLGPAFTYFGDSQVLFGFADYILQTYRDPARIAGLKNMYETGLTPFFLQGRYVSDMHVLGLFAKTQKNTVDLFDGLPNVAFDYAFHTAEGFSFNPYKRIKRIWWVDGQPFGRRSGRLVRFGGLHFQVGTKVFLPSYYRGSTRFPDRWYFRLIQFRGAVTTALKFVLDFGRKWRAEA